ncbi:MAG: F0F1 ATP synthase subunit beta, partial [bacterium]
MSLTGIIKQVLGPNVDIEFSGATKLPAIYNAIKIPRKGDPDLIVEVAQHLGGNVVRTIAMGHTEG